MEAEITRMVDRINKHLNVEMTAEPVRGNPDRYRIRVSGVVAFAGSYVETLGFLDDYWANSRPMSVPVTPELIADVERLLGQFRYVVVDYIGGVRGTSDRYIKHEGTLFNRRNFGYYQANGWPNAL